MSDKLPTPEQQVLIVESCLDFFGGYGLTNQSPFATDNTLWEICGGTGAQGAYWTLMKWMTTDWFLRMVRWRGRTTYNINSYGTAAADALQVLVMGEGYEYQTTDEAKQKAIDEWVQVNNWKERSSEAFLDWLIQGEVFLRLYEGEEVCSIDPDRVTGDTVGREFTFAGQPAQIYQGIISTYDDRKKSLGYRVNYPEGRPGFEDVPIEHMQHRCNAFSGFKRGYSWFLPIFKDLDQAARLAGSNAGALIQQTKIAYIREHDANQQAIQQFRGSVQNALATGGGCGTQQVSAYFGPTSGTDNVENYPDGSIVDANTATKWKNVSLSDSAKAEIAINILLRKISSRMRLPMSFLTGSQDERGAYAAELVSNSHLVRMIKHLQARWIRWDMELLERAGFDIMDVQVIPPEVTVIDKSEEIEEDEFLMKHRIISKKSVGKRHNIDYDAEQEQIKAEGGPSNPDGVEDSNLTPEQKKEELGTSDE